jgi:DNA-binding CsgD family transcriptional regulator
MNRRQTTLLLRLAHLESALDGLKKKLVSDDLDKQARESMVRQIQEINGKEKMWELFSMQFEMTNRKFLDLLSERHPALTKSEKRICAFMLINLSTKEIAELLGRSPRTVDVTKYNIRKKLGITISTEEYLRQVAEEGARSDV